MGLYRGVAKARTSFIVLAAALLLVHKTPATTSYLLCRQHEN